MSIDERREARRLYEAARRAKNRAEAREAVARWWRPRILKDDAPCCNARRDEDGRPPIGWCGPDCVRRPACRDAEMWDIREAD